MVAIWSGLEHGEQVRSGPVRSAGRAHGCGEPMALLEALSGDMNERR